MRGGVRGRRRRVPVDPFAWTGSRNARLACPGDETDVHQSPIEAGMVANIVSSYGDASFAPMIYPASDKPSKNGRYPDPHTHVVEGGGRKVTSTRAKMVPTTEKEILRSRTKPVRHLLTEAAKM